MNKLVKIKFILIILLFIASIYITTCNILYKNEKVQKLPFPKVSLGLDIVGGLQLTINPDFKIYLNEKYTLLTAEINKEMKQEVAKATQEGIVVSGAVNSNLIKKMNLEQKGNLLYFSSANLEKMNQEMTMHAIDIIRNRIDSLGTREINIYRTYSNDIILQLPNVSDSDSVKDLILASAKLNFHIVNNIKPIAKNGDIIPFGYSFAKIRNQEYLQVISKNIAVNGADLTDARISFDNIQPMVAISFNQKGGRDFAKITAQNVGSQLAIVLDNEVISAPRIQSPILSGNATISGNFSPQEMKLLAISLKSGSLPTKLVISEEKKIDASLGFDSIKKSALAMILGLSMIFLFMIIFYKKLGIITVFALIMNASILISLFALIGITLTLGGIAGILLTVAMAVDANVLIYEKMKEFDIKKLTQASILKNGFDGAMSAIVDGNLTTILSTFMLLIFGSIVIKGFAISVILGLLVSFFTSVFCVKAILQYLISKKFVFIK